MVLDTLISVQLSFTLIALASFINFCLSCENFKKNGSKLDLLAPVAPHVKGREGREGLVFMVS